jgi:hypothetical protein
MPRGAMGFLFWRDPRVSAGVRGSDRQQAAMFAGKSRARTLCNRIAPANSSRVRGSSSRIGPEPDQSSVSRAPTCSGFDASKRWLRLGTVARRHVLRTAASETGKSPWPFARCATHGTQSTGQTCDAGVRDGERLVAETVVLNPLPFCNVLVEPCICSLQGPLEEQLCV